MPVIAVVNRKGGSGKSTLATHLAAACAQRGLAVMLGDLDRNQSATAWLRLRQAQPAGRHRPVTGWVVDPRSVMRKPAGITHVVLDTPGGLHGFELARVACHADAILMPVCSSVFDRESAADCYAELLTLPRVASGHCKVAAIGMRLDARTSAADMLRTWAERQGLPFIGVLREAQGYVRCVEKGLSLFDMPAAPVAADMAQWAPILDWLEPVIAPRPAGAARATPPVSPAPSAPLRGTPPAAPVNAARPPGAVARPLPGRQPSDDLKGITIPGLPSDLQAPARPHGEAGKQPAVQPSLGRRVLDALPLRRLLTRNA
jgi:chromosome partitioning protein